MSRLEFSIDRLIKEVQKRTLLYDTTIAAYRDVKAKEREWMEVCRELCTTNDEINDWDDLNEAEKTDFLIEVKKKWTSLRDCYKREQRLFEKNEHNKKKYVFFDKLQFLAPFCRNRGFSKQAHVDNKMLHEEVYIDDEIKPEIENNSDYEEVDENPLNNFIEIQDNTNKTIKILTPQELSSIRGNNLVVIDNKNEKTCNVDGEKGTEKRKRKKEIDKNSDDYEKNKIIREYEHSGETSGCNVSENMKIQGFDDDQAFLKSILPTFKALSTEQKFRLRIEIMQTILKFKVDNKIFN